MKAVWILDTSEFQFWSIRIDSNSDQVEEINEHNFEPQHHKQVLFQCTFLALWAPLLSVFLPVVYRSQLLVKLVRISLPILKFSGVFMSWLKNCGCLKSALVESIYFKKIYKHHKLQLFFFHGILVVKHLPAYHNFYSLKTTHWSCAVGPYIALKERKITYLFQKHGTNAYGFVLCSKLTGKRACNLLNRLKNWVKPKQKEKFQRRTI